MEITVNRAELVRELNLSRGAVESSSTIPILSHVLIEAAGGRVTITATDLDLAIRCSCAAKVQVEGVIAVPGKRFLDYVKLLTGDDVAIKGTENNWISVVSGPSKARMAGMARDNWPELPHVPGMDIEIPGDDLARLIARTEFAISRESSRFTLDGASFLAGDAVSLVATDGHRLAMAGEDAQGKRVLVPRRALTQVARLAAAEACAIGFAHDGNHLFFAIGARLLISRELTGSFPDYSRVLPKTSTHTVELCREELKDAIERVAQFSEEASHAIKVTVKPGELVLHSSVSMIGESEESIAVDFDGAPVEIGFRAEYLLDFLRVVASEKVTFSFTDSASAGEFRPAGEEGYRYVVMPMRI